MKKKLLQTNKQTTHKKKKMEERKSEEEKLHRQKNKIHVKLKLITLSIITIKKRFKKKMEKRRR